MNRSSLINDILGPGGLTIVFQPIFEIVDGETVLYAIEALSRGRKGSNVERADVLFEYVRRKGKEVEVDRACATAALAAAANVPGAPAISINVHASTLECDGSFAAFLEQSCRRVNIETSRLILEIVEHQRFQDRRSFFAALDRLHTLGIRIALDDIGLGYSNHRMLIEVCPDLFKIDRYFVTGSRERPHARAAIESIALLASRIGGRVVAEGIETAEDFETVRSLGIDLVQGYYFGRPAAHPLSTVNATNEEKA